ncbi:lipopolysaccharide biosynthesis protein [Parabacteroides faecis]|uniref:O-antigen/teichoic acid export membrane protein n=1 Tax=Parabacteroides faecis TaxID=1217282 RepID=A0ABR6KRZ1_9BACT|nr:lipopolysaccharide biosynthesis protein [Parabacteroides faecis]MBB4624206.1 O-antigen/teichoic acid export membrane protein [Parabacteroides faecis]GGK12012.1 hypothetical protein GCM10007084_39230 [Parabacteroides faecis]
MGIIIRQSIKGTIVTYIGAFIGFLTTFFILTKFLTPEEIGLTRVLFEAASLLSSFALLGVSSSAIRFFPYFKSEDGKNNGFFFYLLLLPFIGSIVFISLYYFLRDPITDLFIKNSELFVYYFDWVPPFMIFLLYWAVFEVYSILLMRIAVPKLIREIILRLLLVVAYLLYAFDVLDMNGFVACYISVYAISMMLAFLYVSKIGSISLKHNYSFISTDLRKQICSYTMVWMIGALGSNIVSRLDLFMVGSQLGLDYAGIYSIAFYMVAVIEIPSRSIATISSPIASSALKDGDIHAVTQLYRKVSLHQLMVGGFVFLLIWINIDNIFALIPNGEVYSQGKWVVFFLALGKLIEVTLNFGNNLISYSRYYYWGLYFTFFITGIAISLNNWLIPILGVTGAGVATTLTCLISFSAQQWLVQVKIKTNPISLKLVKLIGLFILVFGVNMLLPKYHVVIIDGIYRTVIVSLCLCSLIYMLNISEEVNILVNRFIKKLQN